MLMIKKLVCFIRQKIQDKKTVLVNSARIIILILTIKCLENTTRCLIWLNWSHGKMIWRCDWIVTPRYGPSRRGYRIVDGLKLHLSNIICPATCHYETLPEITEYRQQVEPQSVCRCRILFRSLRPVDHTVVIALE